jgi:hypothetical protein
VIPTDTEMQHSAWRCSLRRRPQTVQRERRIRRANWLMQWILPLRQAHYRRLMMGRR